ncbi:hypothetical protein OH77DRAFT_1302465 [Trametes cingulata]|nr:hypothetical protein OH77DRAFT_1302465 [Trametes cingulata]
MRPSKLPTMTWRYMTRHPEQCRHLLALGVQRRRAKISTRSLQGVRARRCAGDQSKGETRSRGLQSRLLCRRSVVLICRCLLLRAPGARLTHSP